MNKYLTAIDQVFKDEGFYDLKEEYSNEVLSALLIIIQDLRTTGWDVSNFEKRPEVF